MRLTKTKKIARIGGNKKRIDAADFRKLRNAKKEKRKSSVNKSGNYTKPALRKRIFNRILAANIHTRWSGVKHNY